MGWQDRGYSDSAFGETISTRLGLRRPPGGTLGLIIVHAAAFVLVLMLRQTVDGSALAASLALTGEHAQPLAVLLHAFSTTSLLVILFVVLAFWSLGGRLEPREGLSRLMGLYLGGNLAAGAAYWGVAQAQADLATAPLDYPVGALAAFCWTASRRFRHEPVQVFGRETTIATVYAIFAGATVGLVALGARQGALAWLAAAVAGAGLGGLVEAWPAGWWRRRARRPVVRPSIPKAPGPRPVEPEIDDLLAKISQTGLASLTATEQARLEEARQAKLRRTRERG